MVGCGFTPALALRTIMAIAHYVNGSSSKSRPAARRTPGSRPTSSPSSP